jgi:hypothetical protein
MPAATSSITSISTPSSFTSATLTAAPIAFTLGTHASTAPSTDDKTIFPFRKKTLYFCPYRQEGMPCKHLKKCQRAPGEFSSYKGLVQHVNGAHNDSNIVVTDITVQTMQQTLLSNYRGS